MTPSDACSGCGRAVDVEELCDATLLDRDGGSSVRLCSECFAQLEHDRCAYCGGVRGTHPKADGLLPHSASNEAQDTFYALCDGCREHLVAGNTQQQVM